MLTRSRTLLLAAAMASVALLIGCSQSPTQAVSGTVTFDGAPLATGEIEFAPAAGTTGPTAGATIEGGSYSLPAVAQGVKTNGTYTVRIVSMAPSGEFVFHPAEPSGKREGLKNIIPAKYNESSELTITVAPGDNVHNFDLASDASK